ncbi:MAG: zinc-ribbon domain-containing protein [Amphritea sp.]|nr:zinc-ribbon domain-containing protein [Amphritea sp.]
MSRYIITECPACTTRFQVTAGQLKLAGGKVRCGACLEVFNAEVYRCDNIPDPLEALDTSSPDPVESVSEAADKDLLFEAIDIPSFISTSHNKNEDEDRANDQAADELLAEQLNSSPDPGFDNTELEQPVQSVIKEERPSEAPQANAGQTPAATDSNSTEAPEQELQWTDPLANSVAETLRQTDQPLAAEPATEPPTAIVPDPEQTRPFTAVRAEPVMIRSTQTKSGMNFTGVTLVLLAVILFCGQLLWFNRQPLSALPELTQAYQQACQHLPCKLLPVIDLQQIDTRQLVIQEHTQYQGALSVSLLIENIAPVTQPYPAVRLSFTDRKGKLISQRLFQPENYLNNRELNLQQMPAQQMVQISFDILDPGRRAISYEARLEKPRIAAEATNNRWQEILFGRLL